MSRLHFATAILLLAAPCCLAQSSTPAAPATAGQNATSAADARVIGHGSIPVGVTKTLESNKLSAGEILELQISGDFILPGGTRVPKDSKVTAHVVKSTARSKGDADSELTIAFDMIDLPEGKKQPVRGFIQAVGPRLDTSSAVDPAASTMAHLGPPIAPTGVDTSKSGGTNSGDMLNPQSTGVRGVHNLELSADGVLSSKGKTVKLESGYQLIVRVEVLQP